MEIFNQVSKINTKNLNNEILSPQLINKVENINLKQNYENKELNKEEVQKIIDVINNNELIQSNNLQFSLDGDTNTFVVKVTEKENDKLIVQYPNKEFIKNLKYFNDNILELFNVKV